jgi:AcrR family transcriptional regulator
MVQICFLAQELKLSDRQEKPSPRLGRPVGKNKPNAARRRHQLIEATIDSIVKNGLAGTTLATVAAHAGLSQGVVVFYFKNKRQLLLETLRAHYEEYQTAWKTALSRASDDPIERIIILVTASLTDAMSTPRQLALWFSFWGEAKARPQYAQIANSFEATKYQALCALCHEAEKDLVPAGWNAETLAETTEAMTDGFLLKMHISPSTLTPKDARDRLASFLTLVFPQHREKVLNIIDSIS